MKTEKKSGPKTEIKKPKKGKASSGPARRAARAAAAPSPPPMFGTTRKEPPRSGLRVQAQIDAHRGAGSEAPRAEHGPRSAALRCQQLYVAAQSRDASGRIQLDAARLAQALAETGIGVRAEQELYSLALMSAADGHAALFEEDVIAAIAKVG